MKQTIYFFLAILFMGLLFMCDYQHVEHHTVIINDIQTLHYVSGDNESGLSTKYENRIITDNGVFLVHTSGVFSHPEILCLIHVGDTVTITTRGYEIPFNGRYRSIVYAKIRSNN